MALHSLGKACTLLNSCFGYARTTQHPFNRLKPAREKFLRAPDLLLSRIRVSLVNMLQFGVFRSWHPNTHEVVGKVVSHQPECGYNRSCMVAINELYLKSPGSTLLACDPGGVRLTAPDKENQMCASHHSNVTLCS